MITIDPLFTSNVWPVAYSPMESQLDEEVASAELVPLQSIRVDTEPLVRKELAQVKVKEIKVRKKAQDDDDSDEEEGVEVNSVNPYQYIIGGLLSLACTALGIVAAHQQLNILIQVPIAAVGGTAQKSTARILPARVRFPIQMTLCAAGFVFDHFRPGYYVGPVLLSAMIASVQRVAKLLILGKPMWK